MDLMLVFFPQVIDLPEGGAALAVGFIKMHPVKSVAAVLGENLAK
jgi:hypothetical protein